MRGAHVKYQARTRQEAEYRVTHGRAWPLIWTSPICKDSNLLRIEFRLLAYIRLLSEDIQFPSPDGMRASTPLLLRGSREPCGLTGLSTSVQPIRHRLSSLQSRMDLLYIFSVTIPLSLWCLFPRQYRPRLTSVLVRLRHRSNIITPPLQYTT